MPGSWRKEKGTRPSQSWVTSPFQFYLLMCGRSGSTLIGVLKVDSGSKPQLAFWKRTASGGSQKVDNQRVTKPINKNGINVSVQLFGYFFPRFLLPRLQTANSQSTHVLYKSSHFTEIIRGMTVETFSFWLCTYLYHVFILINKLGNCSFAFSLCENELRDWNNDVNSVWHHLTLFACLYSILCSPHLSYVS